MDQVEILNNGENDENSSVQAMPDSTGATSRLEAANVESAASDGTEKQTPKRMLYRNPSDKLIGGVCGGMAEFVGWDATLVRILWIAMTIITGGGGVLAYIALWILLPVGTVADGEQKPAKLSLSEQNLTRVAFLLIGLGGLWLLANIGILPWMWDLFGGVFRILFWPALLIGSGYLVLRYLGRGFRWNVNDTTDKVKSEVNDRMPTTDDMKSGLGKVRENFPLKRSSTDKVFMGVCGGIGQKLGIDANLVRLVWAAFSIGSIGMGVLIYVIAGLFLPEDQPSELAVYDEEAQDVTIIDATTS